MPRRIIMVTCGTLGDLRPYIAVAQVLKLRGHSVALASSSSYREYVTSAGIEFHPIPPDLARLESDPELQRKCLDVRTGTEFIVRQMLLPELQHTYDKLVDLCRGVDLIVGHFLAYAVPLVAEKLDLRWLQVFLHPTNLFSAHDPPVISGVPIHKLRGLGVRPYMLAFRAARVVTGRWMRPVAELRMRAGLPVAKQHPLLEFWSPYGTMGWFPHVLAARQPDWPPRTQITGYPFLDSPGAGQSSIDADLAQFLRTQQPVIFTLGSTAVLQPGGFFETSAAAAARLGVSALLVGCSRAQSVSLSRSNGQVRAIQYAPYDQVFPFARAVVHHGGIGSISEALRAGKRMLIVPFAWDQPDNGARIERLGVGASLARSRYNPATAASALDKLLRNNTAASEAARLSEIVRGENGVQQACSFIEAALP